MEIEWQFRRLFASGEFGTIVRAKNSIAGCKRFEAGVNSLASS
jgi:hypothetical protein